MPLTNYQSTGYANHAPETAVRWPTAVGTRRLEVWHPARPGMLRLEVPQPSEPSTPVIPDAPIPPADPDPGTPAAPEEPATVPAPEEPATPIVPEPAEPDPGSAAGDPLERHGGAPMEIVAADAPVTLAGAGGEPAALLG